MINGLHSSPTDCIDFEQENLQVLNEKKKNQWIAFYPLFDIMLLLMLFHVLGMPWLEGEDFVEAGQRSGQYGAIAGSANSLSL
ncbi:hypothetical protein SUGI_0775150 [Cryptomeria japonica]|nr:hypothetical protein SUGI_0775150 [Cryptomeria japonica]